jgi:hypothetical protein
MASTASPQQSAILSVHSLTQMDHARPVLLGQLKTPGEFVSTSILNARPSTTKPNV